MTKHNHCLPDEKEFPFNIRGVLYTTLTVCVMLMLSASLAFSQKKPSPPYLFAQQNLIAWCIVPYDSKNRSPEERINMLKDLKFSRYAYDWRDQHLPSLKSEIELAEKNNIEITALWMWIDNETDQPGKLSPNNEKLLQIIKDTGIKTQLWIGINSNFFEGVDSDAGRVKKGSEILRYVRERTDSLGVKLGLYNHGDWFGEPDNQIKILKQLNDPAVGIIYNFHHAHEQIDQFPELLNRMLPWLWTVNLNGMKKGGPKILPLGYGDKELAMMQRLKSSGFSGGIGLLGHVEEEDVRVVLEKNLEGLRKLERKLR